MSQHTFETQHAGHRVEVLLGYDRRLNYVFLVVELLDDAEAGNDDEYLYTSLDEPKAFTLPLEHFRGVLSRLQLTVPEQMFEQVKLDASNKAGNRMVTYAADGSFTENSAKPLGAAQA